MAAGGPSAVKNISKDTDFNNELVAAGTKLVVVDFYADWCQPCKRIAPAVASLSMKYSSAVFLKVDVEVCRSTASRYEVNSMPTFLFFRSLKVLQTLKGANESALESAIVQHLGSSQEVGGITPSSVTVPGQINLLSLLDKSGSECLNNSDDHPLSHALDTPTSEQYLESDCDEQLIICIAFTQPVKLHSLHISAPDNGQAPKIVKIFINQPQTLDFDQAEQNKALQELSLRAEDTSEEATIALQYVKYQNVQNITLFVKDNQGGEETTIIHHLAFFGSPLDSTNMSDFKRVAGEKGEKHS